MPTSCLWIGTNILDDDLILLIKLKICTIYEDKIPLLGAYSKQMFFQVH